MALLTALGIALQCAEGLIPFGGVLPGFKIGLANVVVMLLLPCCSLGQVMTVSVLRSAMGSILFGGVSAAIYSVAGAIVSCLTMWLLNRSAKTTMLGIGVAGAAMHNVAQVLTACAMLQNGGVLAYLPPLLILSVITGLFTGGIAQVCIAHQKRIFIGKCEH